MCKTTPQDVRGAAERFPIPADLAASSAIALGMRTLEGEAFLPQAVTLGELRDLIAAAFEAGHKARCVETLPALLEARAEIGRVNRDHGTTVFNPAATDMLNEAITDAQRFAG